MDYLLVFVEGVMTFISPCLLPMLPIYISYFVGQSEKSSTRKTITNALGFILGFTLIFVVLGAFAGTIGEILASHRNMVNIFSGSVMIIFGLNFIGVLNISFINTTYQVNSNTVDLNFLSAILFGIVFSISWTPCIGVFLGSALMLAEQTGTMLQGILMLLSFSLGLAIPLLASVILIDRLKSTFDLIKSNYRLINIVSGGLLIIVGVIIIMGKLDYFMSFLTF